MILRAQACWYCVVLVVCQLVGCATTDRPTTAQPPQAQIVGGLTLKLWSDPSPARVGTNQIFLEVNAPTRNAMVKRDVLLTHQSADGMKASVRMRPAPGKFDTYRAVVELTSSGDSTFTVLVQSPTQAPAIAHFQLPVIASTLSLLIERTDQ